MSASGIDRFHAHLDKCTQCDENPLTGMCREGSRLLKAAVDEASPGLPLL